MKIWSKLKTLLRRQKAEAEMSDEIRLHLELQTERNVAAGMDPDEARYAAHRMFGGVEQVKERCREQRSWMWLEQLGQDLRCTVRHLLKTPVFTAVAVITLALGIGCSTAIFSLLNVLLLRPLPFADPDALVRLRRSTPENVHGAFAPADYLSLKASEASFGRFAGEAGMEVSLSEPGHPAEMKQARRVSADYFAVLRIQPEIGRTFLPEEEVDGRHRVVVISHALWQSRFGGTPDVLGRTVRVDGEETEIVGVLPDWANDSRVIRETALFVPLAFTATERASRETWVGIIGRRAPAVSKAQARELVSAFGEQLAAESSAESAKAAWRCDDLRDSAGNSNGRVIVAMLLGLAGCVLLIACANLANFLLAQTIGRSREFAVRAALGASRLQLIRPLVLEALGLALAGGGAALPVAIRTSRWFSDQSVASGGAPMAFPLDWRVLSFALGASLFTAFFFGVAPALFAMRVNVNDTLKRGARGATESRGHVRWRQTLIVAQFAMAGVLVAGAGLFARGASNFLRLHRGWDPGSIAQGHFELPKARYPGRQEMLAFNRQVLDRLAHLPGVEAASLSYGLPYDGPFGPRPYLVDGQTPPAQGQEPVAAFNGVTDDYFAVTGIRLLRGRGFNVADQTAGRRMVIVNESMARALFPNGDALGHRLSVGQTAKPEWAEIIGVVADVESFAVYRRPIAFQTYHPFADEPWPQVRFAVRTAGLAPDAVLAAARAVITGLDADLPVRELRTADATIEHYGFELTMLRNILGAFSLLGLGLASMGIYGVLARHVARRRGEIGIRAALGANVSDLVRMVLFSGVRLAAIGAGLGVLGAYALAQLIAGLMPSLQTNSDLVLGGTAGILMLIAMVACYLPARRAATVDPVVALRCE